MPAQRKGLHLIMPAQRKGLPLIMPAAGIAKPALLRGLALLLSLGLGACAAPPKPSVAGAVSAPLGDLNLLRAEVPPVLLEALRNPYDLPADQGCTGLLRQIRALDEVLGPDLEPPARSADGKDKPDTRPVVELSTAEAENALLSAIRRTAEGLVPYRSWVRKISGAEQYEKYLATTVAAGSVRRAFLKGLRIAQRCP